MAGAAAAGATRAPGWGGGSVRRRLPPGAGRRKQPTGRPNTRGRLGMEAQPTAQASAASTQHSRPHGCGRPRCTGDDRAPDNAARVRPAPRKGEGGAGDNEPWARRSRAAAPGEARGRCGGMDAATPPGWAGQGQRSEAEPPRRNTVRRSMDAEPARSNTPSRGTFPHLRDCPSPVRARERLGDVGGWSAPCAFAVQHGAHQEPLRGRATATFLRMQERRRSGSAER